MRKILMLPLFVMAIFVSMAQAQMCETTSGQQLYCQWGAATDCAALEVSGADMCSRRAADCGVAKLYVGVSVGGANTCAYFGGTLATGISCVHPSCTGVQESQGEQPDYCDLGTCFSDMDIKGGDGKIYNCNNGGGCVLVSALLGGASDCPAGKIMKKAQCDVCSFPPAERPAGTICSDEPPPQTGKHCEAANGQKLFCNYAAYGSDVGGCFKVENQYANQDKTCEELIQACDEDGTLYVGVTNIPSTGPNADGKGLACVNYGGTTSLSTSSNSSGGGNSSSGGTQGGGGGSSSSGSGSGVTTYAYCIVGDVCYSGPYTFSDCSGILRGVPANTCPPGNSVPPSPSSNSNAGSSSSNSGGGSIETTWSHCIVGDVCTTGPFTLSQCFNTLGGMPSNGCPTPIIVLSQPALRNALSTMQNAVNLQVIGSAVVQVFDLKGNMVRSLKLGQGSYVVPLSGLPKGLYIVKASNASWKQTVKLTIR